MHRLPVRFGLALAAVTFASLLLAVTIVIASDDPKPEPVAGLQNIMNAINHEEHGLYGQIRKFCEGGAAGADAETWKLMRHRAQTMAEIGNVIMDKSPPRGGDDAAGLLKWKKHCVEYRVASKNLGRALAYKKIPKVTAALAELKKRCDACHDDHKPN